MTVEEIKKFNFKKFGIELPQFQIVEVINWNIERGLTTFDREVEKRLMEEERSELKKALDENNTHEIIDAINDIHVVYIGTVYKSLLHEDKLSLLDKKYVLGLIDTVKGIIKKIVELGFEPKCVFNETLLEIKSRVGKINPKTGKWEKDKSEKAKAKWYKANYNLCQLK